MFFLTMPGIALLAEGAPSAVPVEPTGWEGTPVLIAPIGCWGGQVEVLHFHSKRLQLLQRGIGARGLEEAAHTVGLD
jgi:hypothetical protein